MDRIDHSPAPGARRTRAVGHTHTIKLAPAVLGLRTAARAAGYDPDRADDLAALARAVGVDADQLAAALTGRAQITAADETRLARAFGVAAAVTG
ncbi:hypothetical protein [Streptomyces sp. NPDC019937]|uniref:hypothetical protein n=1 Tax=Streptomyces sp. NPDC019937 TaxID=3154787 RepID=UPI0033E699AC